MNDFTTDALIRASLREQYQERYERLLEEHPETSWAEVYRRVVCQCPVETDCDCDSSTGCACES